MARKAAKGVKAAAGKKSLVARTGGKTARKASAASVAGLSAVKVAAKEPFGAAAARAKAATGHINGTHHNAPLAWMVPWSEVGRVAARMMAQDAVKSALERQLQLYQTMARYSPLHITMQFVQGLMPSPGSSQGNNRRH